MIDKAIKRAFEKAKQRGWEKLFVAVDIHDTIVVGNYSKEELSTDFYPVARMCLQHLSQRPDISLILYTCSHPSELVRYKQFFLYEGIHFEYANENPLILTKKQGLGNYDKKLYFDILFEDKAGFDPKSDWVLALNTFKTTPLLKQNDSAPQTNSTHP